MDSRELSEWIAYTRYFEAIPDQWQQTGLIVSALLAPHSRKGQAPRPDDFVPIEKPPQHPDQIAGQLTELQKRLGML